MKTSHFKVVRRGFLALGMCVALSGCDEIEDVLDHLPEFTDDSPGEADSRAETLVESAILPTQLAVNENHIAWIGDHKVWLADQDGSSREDLMENASFVSDRIALDQAGLYLGKGPSLMSAPSGALRLSKLASLDHQTVTMTTDGGFVYLTDAESLSTEANGSVKRIDTATGDVTVLADQLFGPWGVAVDATHAYFTDTTLGGVYRVPKEGGTREELAADLYQPRYVALSDTHVYFNTQDDLDDPPAPTAAKVFRIPLEGGEPEMVADHAGSFAREMTIDDQFVYWIIEGSGIWRAPLAGGSPSKFALGQVRDLVALGGHVYWADDRREDIDDAIRRAAR